MTTCTAWLLIRTAIVGGSDHPEAAYLLDGTGWEARSVVFVSLRSVLTPGSLNDLNKLSIFVLRESQHMICY